VSSRDASAVLNSHGRHDVSLIRRVDAGGSAPSGEVSAAAASTARLLDEHLLDPSQALGKVLELHRDAGRRGQAASHRRCRARVCARSTNVDAAVTIAANATPSSITRRTDYGT
jgi:hypothetical protein